ncbi:MAG: hypothetical protein H0V07_03485 [Propionibacteriales bacterium]|nr:hypothetical protein [Propionibacteriales bacterium]
MRLSTRRRRHLRPSRPAPLSARVADSVIRPMALLLVGLAMLVTVVGRLGLGGPLDTSDHGLTAPADQASPMPAGADHARPDRGRHESCDHGQDCDHGRSGGPRQTSSARFPDTRPPGPDDDRWRRVLGRLDDTRATAWGTADPALLAAVYTPGSPALSLDRRMLADYRGRGLRVCGVHLVFGRIRVTSRGPGVVRLRVVDRLGRVSAVGDNGTRRPLPRDQASVHRLVLRRVALTWRIASIDAV